MYISGPSFSIDTACSSSLLALDQALQAMRRDECDAAIVGGSSLCLNPMTSLQFQKLGMLSPDGACKSFDDSGMFNVAHGQDILDQAKFKCLEMALIT